MPYLSIFGLEFEKVLSYLKSLHTKIPTFGTQNALFVYFWVRISKSYCYI